MDAQNALFHEVKAYLLSQSLGPGSQVEPETRLAARFGVTRHKIREALNTLALMGIVERTPRRGTIIRGFDTGALSANIRFQFEVASFDIAAFLEARTVMECAILPLAVRRVTPAGLAALTRCVDAMEASAATPEEADKYDLAFHLELFKASGNDVLEAFSGVLTTLFKSGEYRKKFRNTDYIINVIVKEHREIIQALAKGDVTEAVQRMRRHLLADKADLWG